MFLAFRTINGLVKRDYEEFGTSFWLHAAAVASFGLVWVACRGGERSNAFVRRAEELGVAVGCAAYAAMGAHIPELARPEMIVGSALTLMLVARAIYVPSTARRTLLLTLALALPLIAMVYSVYCRLEPATVIAIGLAFPEILGDLGGVAMGRVIETAVWWTLTAAICTAASSVIYGLRREARDARKLGQYRLEERLGQGGMGVVYRARHTMLRRPTAVKLLRSGAGDEAMVARFEREVQRTAELSHPNTVRIFDYGRTPDGVFYYAMELLEGANLAEIVERCGAQPPARALHVVASVAGALGEAHRMGLIHRDVKPANIILCEQGGIPDFVKVLDFGLVKEIHDPEGDVALTAVGAITGTPQYMAPEAIRAPDSVDARSDIYALGAVGYYLVTGSHVFRGSNVLEVCGHHMHTEPVPPSGRLGRALPRGIDELLLACLAKSPDDRPQSTDELIARIDTCDVPRWSAADAREWWSANDSKLDRREHSEIATDETIAVDLARRD